jgi:hypothetical protein
MTIGDLKKWVTSLPTEFDNYVLTHREYYDGDGDNLFANELPLVSIHIDDEEKKACFMHEKSYLVFKGDELITKVKVPSTKIEI